MALNLTLKLTTAGRDALPAPDGLGTNAVVIAQYGLSSVYVADTDALTVVPGEFKRLNSLSGVGVADDQIHVSLVDQSSDVYSLRTFGLYLADGTLFAVCTQETPIFEKVATGILMISCDFGFTDFDAENVTFTGTLFNNPSMTETVVGVGRFATEAEAKAGLNLTRLIRPGTMWQAVRQWFADWKAAKDVWGKDNDGAGSTLDADLLDGQEGSWYANIIARLGFTPANKAGDNFTGPVTISGHTVWHAGNDGAGSGADADLLDGQQGSWYADILARMGFTPVQQGGGSGQSNNKIYLGWNGSRLKAQVDTSDLGSVVFDNTITGHLSDKSLWGKDNDGAGSTLDADLLDGQEGSWYANIIARLGFTPANKAGDNFTGPVTISGHTVWHAGNDGAGSGADADLLDGQQGSWYADILARLGFTPVQQGGGSGHLVNKVYLGWSGSRLKAQVDEVDLGAVVFDSTINQRLTDKALWGSGNDGAGSTLDADLLDGYQGADFARKAEFTSDGDATGGWRKTPDGYIDQWSQGYPDAGGAESPAQTLYFPIPFPTTCLDVQVTTWTSESTNTDTVYQLISFDHEKCVVRKQRMSTSDTLSVTPRIRAFGK